MSGQQTASSAVHYPNASDGSNTLDIFTPQTITAVNQASSRNIVLYPGPAWAGSIYTAFLDVVQHPGTDIYKLYDTGTTNSALVGAFAQIVWNQLRIGVRVSSKADYTNPTSPTGPWKIVWSDSLGIGNLLSLGGTYNGAKLRVQEDWAAGDNAQTDIPSKTGAGSILQIGIFKD